MESEFPSNNKQTPATRKADPKSPQEKNVQKVVTGSAVKRKKSLGRRFKETFISGAGNKTVFDYVVFEILIPAGKDIIVDATNAGLQRKLYGDSYSPSRRGGYGLPGSTSYTPYNRVGSSPMIDQVLGRAHDPRAPGMSRRSRATHDFGEIVIPTRHEANAVLQGLYDLITRFDVATVADLYEMTGFTPEFTDNKWGWESLQGADVRSVGGGYVLILPRPEPVE